MFEARSLSCINGTLRGANSFTNLSNKLNSEFENETDSNCVHQQIQRLQIEKKGVAKVLNCSINAWVWFGVCQSNLISEEKCVHAVLFSNAVPFKGKFGRVGMFESCWASKFKMD